MLRMSVSDIQNVLSIDGKQCLRRNGLVCLLYYLKCDLIFWVLGEQYQNRSENKSKTFLISAPLVSDCQIIILTVGVPVPLTFG